VFVLTTNTGATFYIPAIKIYEGHILNVKLILCYKDFVLKTCGGIVTNGHKWAQTGTNPQLNIFVRAFAKLRKAIITFVMSVCRSARIEDSAYPLEGFS
jgi:hypothetical protein